MSTLCNKTNIAYRFPQVLLNGVALDENSLNADEFEEAVLTELMRQTSALQKALFRGIFVIYIFSE